MFQYLKKQYGIVFPGDPDYDVPNPNRDWHFVIIFAPMIVFVFLAFVTAYTRQPLAFVGLVASLITLVVAWITSPFDPRYP